MEIKKFDSKNLRNEEHYEFHAQINGLIIKYTPANLGVEVDYPTYLSAFNEEGEAVDFIRKSATTEQLETADYERDLVFRGLADSVKTGQQHFKPEVRKAADKLAVMLDHYGNVARMPYDQETGALTTLLVKLTTQHSAEINIVGVSEWIGELSAKNKAFSKLMASRTTESANKTKLRMTPIRLKVDDAYTILIKRVNALAIVNGEAAYKDFINELNDLINRLENTLAKRQGIASKAKDETAVS